MAIQACQRVECEKLINIDAKVFFENVMKLWKSSDICNNIKFRMMMLMIRMMMMMSMMMNCWEWRKRRWRPVIRANREDFRTRYLASAARCGGSPLATSSSPRPPYHQNTSASSSSSSSSSSSIIISVKEIFMKLQTWTPYPWSSRTDSRQHQRYQSLNHAHEISVRLNLHAVQHV